MYCAEAPVAGEFPARQSPRSGRVSRAPCTLKRMAPIINAHDISRQFGEKPLFQGISLTVDEGDRIGLIGPNGAGKSTLLALLAGAQEPDSGEVARRKRARVAYVPQDSRFAPGLSVRKVLEAALDAAHVPEDERLGRLHELTGRTGFADIEAEAAQLSGGWRKRLAIAEALVSEPEVLLLDEPTNHLDLAGIEWLEGLLASSPFATVTVTHDRYFLEATSNQIVELSKVYAEGLLRIKGNFSRFLEEKQIYLDSQSRMQESLRNRVRTEIEWLRRGPKARTTKSKARIDTAHEMIRQLADIDSRTVDRSAAIDFDATDRQTKRLVEFNSLGYSFPPFENQTEGLKLFSGMDFVFRAGTRVGLVGPNGSGKTTLLRLLTGELEPSSGEIRRADALRVVYFNQNREIDESLTLRRALSPDSDSVIYQGRVIHVATWADRFLFKSEQLNQPVKNLSGGERARVLIAKLMLEPADVLLLDEPTNDLDLATLDILEETLSEFPGALVLVTHDRYLLNAVAQTVLGLDGRGQWGHFADYAQWENWIEELESAAKPQKAETGPVVEAKPAPEAPKKKKLSYLEAREFAGIEEKVEASDARVATAESQVASPEIASNGPALEAALKELEEAKAENEAVYARWAELSEKAGEA